MFASQLLGLLGVTELLDKDRITLFGHNFVVVDCMLRQEKFLVNLRNKRKRLLDLNGKNVTLSRVL